MERKFAWFFSILFHPLLITSYTLGLLFSIRTIFNSAITLQGKLMVMGFVFSTTFIFPLMLILILLRKGNIKSLQMETREERVFPLILTAAFYYSTYYVLRQIQIPNMFQLFLLGTTFLIALALLINFWWKISIHMIALGGMIGTMIGISMQLNYDMRILIALLFIFAGLTAFSRLKLSSHNPAQVYTGFLMGLLLMLLLFIQF